MRYFLEFSYCGKAYSGWQRQPDASSVQETMEHALSLLLKTPVALVGAGRTDSGVHARQMFAHFDIDCIPDESQLIHRLNAFLPNDISIENLVQVHSEAHARFDAVSRTYEYWITTRKNPFLTERAYQVKQPLQIAPMNEAASLLLDYQDFQCFSKSNTDVKTFLCTILYAKWEEREDLLVFQITANRFLRNMVRAIVGTLLEVGQGKRQPEDVKKIIKSKNRSNAGASVPAHALYLTKVIYPKTTFKAHE